MPNQRKSVPRAVGTESRDSRCPRQIFFVFYIHVTARISVVDIGSVLAEFAFGKKQFLPNSRSARQQKCQEHLQRLLDAHVDIEVMNICRFGHGEGADGMVEGGFVSFGVHWNGFCFQTLKRTSRGSKTRLAAVSPSTFTDSSSSADPHQLGSTRVTDGHRTTAGGSLEIRA